MKWHKLLIVVGVWMSLIGWIGGYVFLGVDQAMYLGWVRTPWIWVTLIGAVGGPFVTLFGLTVWFVRKF